MDETLRMDFPYTSYVSTIGMAIFLSKYIRSYRTFVNDMRMEPTNILWEDVILPSLKSNRELFR